MLLGIDVGNTNIVAALIDNGEVIAQCRYVTAKNERRCIINNSLIILPQIRLSAE